MNMIDKTKTYNKRRTFYTPISIASKNAALLFIVFNEFAVGNFEAGKRINETEQLKLKKHQECHKYNAKSIQEYRLFVFFETLNNLWADLSQGMANSQMEPWNSLWADLSQGMANSQMEP